MMRDRFVAGIKSEILQKKLLQEDDDVTLDKVFAVAISFELAEINTRELQDKLVAKISPGETDATINLTVDYYSLCFTIDTGSPVTLIPEDIYKNYWQEERKKQLEQMSQHKSFVTCSLWVGSSKDVIRTLSLRVPSNSTFYDFMLLASAEDPCFEIKCVRPNGSHIYSICERSNSMETLEYWQLFQEHNGTITALNEDISKITVKDKDIKQRSSFDQVSEFDRERIVAYRDCGLSFREIGSRVGRNQTTVMWIWICDRLMQEVSARTIRRNLKQSGLSARRPLLRLPLTQNLTLSPANGAMKEGCGRQNGMKLSLLTSHASVCSTTMVGFESGDTVKRGC
ncbi:hypothetical protein LAZ67_5003313 [Cordylochernes scorpioides]|uniref:Uncharacterized protein n=1 Tax=Cordylochernes scorpioides TaxID=51811 RepID=A0ABY6KH85_9ARAC|nr:hypothetical protein LAZ67_5003313 [Cordylochernes scorpioides]